MSTWIVIVAVGLGSYALRALPVLLELRWLRSPTFERSVAHAATAATAALVTLGLRRSATSPAHTIAVIAAASVALLVASRGRSMLAVLASGASVYGLVLVGAFVW